MACKSSRLRGWERAEGFPAPRPHKPTALGCCCPFQVAEKHLYQVLESPAAPRAQLRAAARAPFPGAAQRSKLRLEWLMLIAFSAVGCTAPPLTLRTCTTLHPSGLFSSISSSNFRLHSSSLAAAAARSRSVQVDRQPRPNKHQLAPLRSSRHQRAHPPGNSSRQRNERRAAQGAPGPAEGIDALREDRGPQQRQLRVRAAGAQHGD